MMPFFQIGPERQHRKNSLVKHVKDTPHYQSIEAHESFQLDENIYQNPLIGQIQKTNH